MTRVRSSILLFVALGAGVVEAAAQENAWPWSTCFKAFEVRKAFDGGKDEAQPAVLSIVNIHDENTDVNGAYLVDAGIRNKRCSIRQMETGELSVGASAEWHLGQANALREEKKRNRLKGSLAAYYSRTVAEREDADGNETFSARLWIVLKGDRSHDYVDDTTAGSVSLMMSPSIITKSLRSFWPGESLTVGDVTLAYYPSTGPEYLRKLKIGTVAPAFEGVDWLLRIEGLASFGVSGPGQIDGRFQLAADTAWRWRVSGLDTIADGRLTWSSVTATLWMDDGRRVGVGYALDAGRSPVTNFIAQRRSSVGLQVKF